MYSAGFSVAPYWSNRYPDAPLAVTFNRVVPCKYNSSVVNPAVVKVVMLPKVNALNVIPFPAKKLAVTRLPKLALPPDILPVTSKLVSVPTLVMFGCAFV